MPDRPYNDVQEPRTAAQTAKPANRPPSEQHDRPPLTHFLSWCLALGYVPFAPGRETGKSPPK